MWKKNTEEDRKAIFDKFWAIGDHTKQWEFLLRHITETSLNQEISPRKRFSRKFFFKIQSKEIPVCETMFLNTLSISKKWIETALKKNKTGNEIIDDKREKTKNHPRMIDPLKKQSVVDHINAFPKRESHFLWKCTTREYLEENLSIARMYELYIPWCEDNGRPAAWERKYRDIFNTEFNLDFFQSKKDRCNECEVFGTASDERKEALWSDYDNHIKNKIKARDFKENYSKIFQSTGRAIFWNIRRLAHRRKKSLMI